MLASFINRQRKENEEEGGKNLISVLLFMVGEHLGLLHQALKYEASATMRLSSEKKGLFPSTLYALRSPKAFNSDVFPSHE